MLLWRLLFVFRLLSVRLTVQTLSVSQSHMFCCFSAGANCSPAKTNCQDAVSVVMLWGIAETGIGITAASLSALRPLFRTFIGSSSNSAKARSYPLATMPAAPGRRSTVDSEDVLENKYEVDPLTGQVFQTSTEVSTGQSNFDPRNQSQGSLDMHGDSNSETEILDLEFRRNGIKMETTFKMESTRKQV